MTSGVSIRGDVIEERRDRVVDSVGVGDRSHVPEARKLDDSHVAKHGNEDVGDGADDSGERVPSM